MIVYSYSISAGKKEDRAGKFFRGKIQKLVVEVPVYILIPDEKEEIKEACLKYVYEEMDLVIFSGGRGIHQEM